MKHKSPTYIRKGRTITPADPRVAPETFPSISAAKRWSSTMQKANGGLGCGFIRVVRGK